MNTVTATLDNDSMERLSKMAEATQRSLAWLVAEAVRNYLREEVGCSPLFGQQNPLSKV